MTRSSAIIIFKSKYAVREKVNQQGNHHQVHTQLHVDGGTVWQKPDQEKTRQAENNGYGKGEQDWNRGERCFEKKTDKDGYQQQAGKNGKPHGVGKHKLTFELLVLQQNQCVVRSEFADEVEHGQVHGYDDRAHQSAQEQDHQGLHQ